MTRIITALFDTRADAEAGSERLRHAGIDADHVKVQDQSSRAGTDASSSVSSTGQDSGGKDRGLWESIKHLVLPDEDRHTYEEGVRRGGFLLTAEVDDDKTPDAVRALEEADSIDLDARSEQWRSDGWNYTGATDIDGSDDDVRYGVRDTQQGTGRFRSYTAADRGQG